MQGGDKAGGPRWLGQMMSCFHPSHGGAHPCTSQLPPTHDLGGQLSPHLDLPREGRGRGSSMV